MASEREQAIRDFVREDGNEEFRPQLERTCPHCYLDRKTLALACVSESPEDQAAAWSVSGSCAQCKGAMAEVMEELAKRRMLREQGPRPKCGSLLIREIQLCAARPMSGGADFPGDLSCVRENSGHYEARPHSLTVLVAFW